MAFEKLFQTSIKHGRINLNGQRTESYVMDKIVEEVGELALEKQIKEGRSYKEPGVDGIPGEAVDLTISAIDMFCLQFPDLSPSEIMKEFEAILLKKMQKWDKVHSIWLDEHNLPTMIE